MSSKSKDGEITVSFRSTPKDMETFASIAHDQFGHGGMSQVLNSLIKNYIQKFDGKSSSLDTFLDPNFTPKPKLYDDIEKNVMPYAANLSDSDLHEFRIWLYQGYNVCMAYAKMAPNKRKNTKMTYQQLFDLVYKSDR